MKDRYGSDSQERKWIELAQQHDLEAFNQLVLAYQDAAFNLASWLLDDQACAEDIVQTAFIITYNSIQRFRGGSFRAWLLTIVRNSCIDELRRRIRHPWLPLEPTNADAQELEEASWLADPGPSPEELCIEQESWKTIERIIQQLANPLREALILVDIQALNYQEAAAILNVPVGTIKSRLARARSRLRAVLGEGMLSPATSDNSTAARGIEEQRFIMH